MELRAGLVRTGTLDVEATRALATREGFATFVLPAHGIVDKASFFDAVRTTLPLDPPFPEQPERPGFHSWDALEDSLFEGLHVTAEQPIAVLWPNAHTMASAAPADFEIALSVLTSVVMLLGDSRVTVDRPVDLAIIVECAEP